MNTIDARQRFYEEMCKFVEPVTYTVHFSGGACGWCYYEAHDCDHARSQHLALWPQDKILRIHKGPVTIKFS